MGPEFTTTRCPKVDDEKKKKKEKIVIFGRDSLKWTRELKLEIGVPLLRILIVIETCVLTYWGPWF